MSSSACKIGCCWQTNILLSCCICYDTLCILLLMPVGSSNCSSFTVCIMRINTFHS